MDILGLPLHPLVVHLAVVALPIGALATVASVVSPAFRVRWALLSLGTLTVGALGAVLAKISGEALAEVLTPPELHATLGNATLLTAGGTATLGWLWWFLERRQAKAPAGTAGLAAMMLGGLLTTAGLALAVLTILTGHAGAQATWSSRMTAAAGAAPTASAPATFTVAEVAAHNTPASCWAIVDGGVYDLTRWADHHPGGRERIRALCGTDATEQFRIQHRDAARPNAQLSALRIGDLSR